MSYLLLKSSNFNTSERNTGFGMSSLGSLPGFISSLIISFRVGSPTSSCFASSLMSLSLFSFESFALISLVFLYLLSRLL